MLRYPGVQLFCYFVGLPLILNPPVASIEITIEVFGPRIGLFLGTWARSVFEFARLSCSLPP